MPAEGKYELDKNRTVTNQVTVYLFIVILTPVGGKNLTVPYEKVDNHNIPGGLNV
ncbi:MAG TPA: hypothetical protein VGB01_08125 [candidate division Zixibacteria bacterium]